MLFLLENARPVISLQNEITLAGDDERKISDRKLVSNREKGMTGIRTGNAMSIAFFQNFSVYGKAWRRAVVFGFYPVSQGTRKFYDRLRLCRNQNFWRSAIGVYPKARKI